MIRQHRKTKTKANKTIVRLLLANKAEGVAVGKKRIAEYAASRRTGKPEDSGYRL